MHRIVSCALIYSCIDERDVVLLPSKKKKFADDGWAVWVDDEDTSTIYK